METWICFRVREQNQGCKSSVSAKNCTDRPRPAPVLSGADPQHQAEQHFDHLLTIYGMDGCLSPALPSTGWCPAPLR